MTNDILANRRSNLRNLIEQWYGPLALAKKLGYTNASFLVQMCGPNPTREVTEKTARKTEQALGLPAGWMDDAPGHNEKASRIDMGLVSLVIRTVMQAAEENGLKLLPDKLGDIVSLVYADAASNNSIVRPDYVQSIIKLTK
jgi:hypothetical protein